MDAVSVLQVLTLLFVKHFVVDFPLQGPYQFMNKGTYGHPGGVLHSGLQGLGTFFAVVWFVSPFVAFFLSLADALTHYHIDFAKVNINRHYGWDPKLHPEFWILLGFDQLLHAVTYLAIVLLMI